MLRKSLSLNTFLAILTAMGYVKAEVRSPTTPSPTPLKQYCTASLDVEYSAKLIFSIVMTLSLEAVCVNIDLAFYGFSGSFGSVLREAFHFKGGYDNYEISQINMFCCSRRENHRGEIVNAVCLDGACVKSKNQLACIQCLQEEHQGHSTTSLKILIPQLLEVHSEKLVVDSKLQRLFTFVVSEFGYEFMSGQTTTNDNLVERIEELLLNLKREVESTNEEINKMKGIFKNLNKVGGSQIIPKSSIRQTEYVQEELKHNPSTLSPNKSNLVPNTKSKMFSPLSSSNKAEIDTFSISFKHPYLHLSPDLRTVTKVSHSGHRFAVIGGKPFNERQNEICLKIDKSVSGNIMLGICHQNIVKEKDFSNCYGINSGTYLISQNGNDPTTAISFHHCLTVYNRKEVVGWNFQTGEELSIGIHFEDELIFFRKQHKGANLEFTMKIRGESQSEPTIQSMNLKLVVLLQTEGDQVSILEG